MVLLLKAAVDACSEIIYPFINLNLKSLSGISGLLFGESTMGDIVGPIFVVIPWPCCHHFGGFYQ
jgi:hypothetical protein